MPTLTADETEMVYLTHTRELCIAKRPSSSDAWGTPEPFPTLGALELLHSPWLSPDGLTLLIGANHGYVCSRRAQRDAPWGAPEPLLFDAVMSSVTNKFGPIQWVAELPGGQAVLAARPRKDSRLPYDIVLGKRTGSGKEIGNFKPLALPGLGQLKGRAPRYVPATNELFFTAPLERDQPTNDDNPLELWVLKHVVIDETGIRVATRATASSGPSEATAPEQSGAENFEAGGWIDVIPLIDPTRDVYHAKGHDLRIDWQVRDGELICVTDSSPDKLLFPLVLDGPSLEWEIEFTRTSGVQGFSTDVPASAGVVPVIYFAKELRLGAAVSNHQKVFPLGAAQCIETGRPGKLRVSVRHSAGEDYIALFIDGRLIASWTGDRNEMAKPLRDGDNYSTHTRT